MDCKKSGALIRRLRLGKDMTQSALAEILGVSVQAVSKWERGLGYPDVSLINDLSSILGVDAKGGWADYNLKCNTAKRRETTR